MVKEINFACIYTVYWLYHRPSTVFFFKRELIEQRTNSLTSLFIRVIKQFISIVINLLDALKTSFSHRSMTARSLGRRDTVSEAAIASISMLKVRSSG